MRNKARTFSILLVGLSSFMSGIYSMQHINGEDIGLISFFTVGFLLFSGIWTNLSV